MADHEQVIIIGSGPAGYTAALYTARANLSPLVIEGFLWGGLLQQTTEVENYPGFTEGIMGPELMQTMRDQAERFGARYLTDNATRFEPAAEEGGLHTVWVDDEAYKARTVILAMGAEHKKLAVPGEEELANGRGVSYCATCDAAFYKDRETIVVGGGDSAMEEAIFLAKFSSKVTIVHRRDEFRASQIMFDRAKATENIELLTPYVVEEFLPGENGSLGSARLRHAENGETEHRPQRLLGKEEVRLLKTFERDDGRCAVDHDDADADERQRCQEQPLVRLKLPRHTSHPRASPSHVVDRRAL
jgi:thioredoxin reductase (NADPH)